jgi:hypothetical protein
MLTGMTERDWTIVLEVFDAAPSRRGEPGHDDRKFLEAVHYFTVHNITWRALPNDFGNCGRASNRQSASSSASNESPCAARKPISATQPSSVLRAG